MRYPLLMIMLLLVTACGTKSSHPEAQAIVKYGVIAGKRDVSVDQVEKKTRGTTSVYGSVSSGGGVSIGIGIGMLLSSIGGGSDEPKAVRYDVDLTDGGQITVYHESPHFEVKDCVKITVHPDEQEHPPGMERSKDGCG